MRFIQLGRREFITLIGGAAATWPLGARAQQPERMRRISVLMGGSEEDAGIAPRAKAFRDSLQWLGWSEGQNVQIEYRWKDRKRTRLNSRHANISYHAF